jgi:hypothetical protein
MGLFDTLMKAGEIVAAPATGGASLTPMLVGAAAGAAKHFLVDKPEQEKSAQLQADIMRYSPWTGLQGPGIHYAPGLFSSALQGGAMGASIGNALGGAVQAAPAAMGQLEGGSMLSPMAGEIKPWMSFRPEGGGSGYDWAPGATSSGRGMYK